MQVIYETKGRAREFSELACNLFSGCEHGCIYCWSPQVTHKTREEFLKPQIRVTPLDMLKSAKQWRDKCETRSILLSFTCDPYQCIEQETQLTRKCIMALHEAGLNVIILTKGGLRSMRDFDLLTSKDAYATTLTCLHEPDSRYWEPIASMPKERIVALQEAHKSGIETWVSFEPVIYPQDTLYLLEITAGFVGHYKIGKMNYYEHGKSIDWKQFGWEIKRKMDKMGVKYYFKKDLLKEMGVLPADFRQTWVCK